MDNALNALRRATELVSQGLKPTLDDIGNPEFFDALIDFYNAAFVDGLRSAAEPCALAVEQMYYAKEGIMQAKEDIMKAYEAIKHLPTIAKKKAEEYR